MGIGIMGVVAGTALQWVATAVYANLRSLGERGFTRFLAFWFGAPYTVAALLLVREGSRDRVRPPPDDEAALFAEVRRDRVRRLGDGGREVSGRERAGADEGAEAPSDGGAGSVAAEADE